MSARASLAAFRRPEGGGGRPLIFGHRGLGPRGPVPENTLLAFDRAADEGADGIELDVRLARSGEVIVLHDPDLARVTHGHDRREASALDLSSIARVDLDGEKIPRLDNVLALAHDRDLLVNIELKHDEPRQLALVRGVKKALERGSLPADRVVLSSFHPKLVMLSAALIPGVGRAFLCHHGQRHQHPFAVARALRPTAVHPEWTLLLAAPSLPLHARTGPSRPVVSVWTVNDEAAARTMAALPDGRVDSLITDRPGALRHLFENGFESSGQSPSPHG